MFNWEDTWVSHDTFKWMHKINYYIKKSLFMPLPHTQCSGDKNLCMCAMLSPFFHASLPKTVFSQLYLWLNLTHILRLNLRNFLRCVRSNHGHFHNTLALTHYTRPPWHSVNRSVVLHHWLHISLSPLSLWVLLRIGAFSKSLFPVLI